MHTKEPWSVSGTNHLVGADGKVISYDDLKADSIRIAACVNACAGFSIEELEGASLFMDSFTAQNKIDELLAIVKDMRNEKAEVFSMSPEGRAYLSKMNAAIAK